MHSIGKVACSGFLNVVHPSSRSLLGYKTIVGKMSMKSRHHSSSPPSPPPPPLTANTRHSKFHIKGHFNKQQNECKLLCFGLTWEV